MSQPDLFNQLVTETLDNFYDPEWLGKESKLATPYILGEYLQERPKIDLPNPANRGRLLQGLIQHAAEQLAGNHDQVALDSWNIIQQIYLAQPSLAITKFSKQVGEHRSKVSRHRDHAISELAEQLLKILRPTLRLEHPERPDFIYGYDTHINRARDLLADRQAISLTGLGGVGKTTLARFLAHQLCPPPEQQQFWFTFRPGLNDQLWSVALALGYYLHQRMQQLKPKQTSLLFSQLMALSDKEIDQIEGQLTNWLRHDLTVLADDQLIFCFDELDLLAVDTPAHNQLRRFLHSLTELSIPLIFIEQIPTLEVPHTFKLDGLTESDTVKLLKRFQLELLPPDLKRLMAYTAGNARLLRLFVTLWQYGADLESLLTEDLAQAADTEFLLNRIWERLSDHEEELLAQLAVFRQAVPAEEWPTEVVQKLVDRELIQRDEVGNVLMIPAFQQVIYRNLPPEVQQACHFKAAEIRQNWFDYVSAMYHFIQANQPAQAIGLWQIHHQNLLAQGQGFVVRPLLEQISTSDLSSSERETLKVLLAELYKLGGNYERVREILKRPIRQSLALQALAHRLQGDIDELQSRNQQAIKNYRQGLESIEKLSYEMTLFRRGLSWGHKNKETRPEAWRQSQLGRYEIDNLQGYLHLLDENFGEAERLLTQALTLAQELEHQEGIAKTSSHLGQLYARQHRFAEAESHQQRCYELYQKIGYQSQIANSSNNIGFRLLYQGQYATSIPYSKEALTIYEQLEEVEGVACAANNLAYAYVELEQLDEAEQFAWQAIGTEEAWVFSDAYRILGLCQLRQGKATEAKQSFDQALDFAQQDDSQEIEAWIWRDLIEFHACQKQNGEVETAKEKAIALFEQLGGMAGEIEKTNARYAKFMNNNNSIKQS